MTKKRGTTFRVVRSGVALATAACVPGVRVPSETLSPRSAPVVGNSFAIRDARDFDRTRATEHANVIARGGRAIERGLKNGFEIQGTVPPATTGRAA
ncbi:MAG TPA: hypothetical protein VGP25_10010 [Gemmatimonadaceae bacterium]|nr:hypothetical protein [Gemmatimonadaceae bacterium]